MIEITKPSFFKRVSDLVASNPPHKWRAFLRTHILYNTSPLLPQVFLDANFELDSVFTGVTPEPRTPNPEPRTPNPDTTPFELDSVFTCVKELGA